MFNKFSLLSIFLISLTSLSVGSEQLKLATVDNGYYTSFIDCKTKLPLAVVYELSQDKGVASRYSSYIDDEELKRRNPDCHPNTDHQFKTFQSVLKSKGIKASYDVGHIAMSNHLDMNDRSIKLANQWTNLAPQSSNLNRNGGAWYEVELVTECQRELETIVIVAGVIDDPTIQDKDYFVDTFGQTTPDYFYRIIYWTESRVYRAWLMPNEPDATREKLFNGEYNVGAEYLDSKLPIALSLIQDIKKFNIPIATDDFVKTDVKGTKLSCRGQTTDLS